LGKCLSGAATDSAARGRRESHTPVQRGRCVTCVGHLERELFGADHSRPVLDGLHECMRRAAAPRLRGDPECIQLSYRDIGAAPHTDREAALGALIEREKANCIHRQRVRTRSLLPARVVERGLIGQCRSERLWRVGQGAQAQPFGYSPVDGFDATDSDTHDRILASDLACSAGYPIGLSRPGVRIPVVSRGPLS
jgi:hypothetical protein